MTEWSNPETFWDHPDPAPELTGLVEDRLGRGGGTPELLSGGLRNLNIRLGTRVLRILLASPSGVPLEAALLRRPWVSLRVPGVLMTGPDFLLLEYVPHQRLRGTREEGVAAGCALAEIHSSTYPTAGLLDPKLRVSQPFYDPIMALVDHVRSCLQAADISDPSAATILGFLEGRIGLLSKFAGPPVLLHADFKVSNLHWTSDARLLVLDWEFAYAGPALMDVGQLFRWPSPAAFCSAFEESYRASGGTLPTNWRELVPLFDLFNLADLLARARPGSRQALDIAARMHQTLSEWD